MSIIIPEKEEMHNVDVKFTHAYLPEAGKPYNLRPANQAELDLREVAVKAKSYKMAGDVDAMIEGFTSAMEAICYLVADGYKVKTDYFTAGLSIPGEYDGHETSMPEGVFPAMRLRISGPARKYIKERINIMFDGTFEKEGRIARAIDDATGAINEVLTIGSILTINGVGLKVIGDPENRKLAGVYFLGEDGGMPTQSKVITVNERKTLKVLVPATLVEGKKYTIIVDTWCRASHSGGIVKDVRTMQSPFALTARKPD